MIRTRAILFLPILMSLGLVWLAAAVERAPAETPASQPAETQSPAKPTLTELVAQLRAPQFEVRDHAQEALLRLPAEKLSEIEGALAKESDAEAEARLTRVAVHLFLKARTPFVGQGSMLGIALNIEAYRTQHRDEAPRAAIAVTQTQPGFPAAEQLRPGDRILAIDHHTFPLETTIDDFRNRITANSPGTILHFTVLRNGREMQMDIMLAGLPDAGAAGIAKFISERETALREYMAKLHPTDTSKESLTIKDDSPVPGPDEGIPGDQ